MTRATRFMQSGMGRVMAIFAGVLCLATLSTADSAKDSPAVQQEKQKLVQAETDKTVRRMNTMIRLLAYNQLDKASETRLLEEVAQTLAGLSKDQMNDILMRLEAAARIPDETKSQQELETAYSKHREVITILKGMIAKYDALKNLEQASERLENAAGQQLEVYLKTSQALQEKKNTVEKLFVNPKLRLNAANQIRHQADDQRDLKGNVADLMKQLNELRPSLPPEQQHRLDKMQTALEKKDVLGEMNKAAELLEAKKDPAIKAEEALSLQARPPPTCRSWPASFARPRIASKRCVKHARR